MYDSNRDSRGRLFVGAFAVVLALILDIIGVVSMFSQEWLRGIAVLQLATFLVLFAIWIEG